MTFKDLFYNKNTTYLLESRYTRYVDIFQDFFKALKELLPGKPVSDIPPKVTYYLPSQNAYISEEEINHKIKKAIRILEREDRILWYLRLLKLGCYLNLITSVNKITGPEEKEPIKLPEYITSYLLKTSNKKVTELPAGMVLGMNYVIDDILRSCLGKLEHFLSLPIREIQEFQFVNQKPKEVFSYFEALEEKWKDEGGDREIDITEELNDGSIEQILSYNSNAYGWFNLKKAYCSKEGRSMGHCGNSPRQNTSDTVFSFRTIKKFKGNTTTIPHLTFIITNKGELTESKGRGNNKPIEKYHPYIVSLLSYKPPGTNKYLISAVKGGGYMPENNFFISDLTTKDMLVLIRTRPELIKESDIIAHIQSILRKGNDKLDKDAEELIKTKFYEMKDNGYSHPAIVGFLLPLMLEQGNEIPSFFYDLFKEYTVNNPTLRSSLADLLSKYNKEVPSFLLDS